MSKVLVLLCVALLLAGCACGTVEVHGTVVDKSFTPRHSDFECLPVMDGDGDMSISCYTETTPDKWTITLNVEGRVYTYWATQEEYEAAVVGRRGAVSDYQCR